MKFKNQVETAEDTSHSGGEKDDPEEGTIRAHSYIDIHCHMLPGVDDGADSLETSLSMLKLSEEQGAASVILTPHYYHERNRYRKGELAERFAALCEAAQDAGIVTELFLGNEILWFDGAIEALREGEALSLAQSRYILIEFYPDSSARELLRAVRSSFQGGYIPVIAHYERYRALRGKDGDALISELIGQGALLQMNYASIGGRSGLSGLLADANTKWCRNEIKKGHVSFLGTDAHNLGHRSPEHGQAAAWLLKHMEEDARLTLLLDNPGAILDDEPL